jgi:hypothetical protein
MLAFIPSANNLRPTQLGNCGKDCSISTELGIPCCHILCSKMENGRILTKWDVHYWWHLRDALLQDSYQRILNPKIAEDLRGRPRNTPQASFPGLSSGKAASKSNPQPARRPPKGALGTGNTTGHRAAGQQLQPSIRRQRSQWELMDAAPISRRTRSSGHAADVIPTPAAVRRRAPPTCGPCGEIGHRSTNRACSERVSQALAELVTCAADNASDGSANNVTNAIWVSYATIIIVFFFLFPLIRSLQYDNLLVIY